MKMNSAQIRQTLHQFEAQAIPAGNRIAAPAVSSEWRLFRAGRSAWFIMLHNEGAVAGML
jgi:hypothetical protein